MRFDPVLDAPVVLAATFARPDATLALPEPDVAGAAFAAADLAGAALPADFAAADLAGAALPAGFAAADLAGAAFNGFEGDPTGWLCFAGLVPEAICVEGLAVIDLLLSGARGQRLARALVSAWDSLIVTQK